MCLSGREATGNIVFGLYCLNKTCAFQFRCISIEIFGNENSVVSGNCVNIVCLK